MLGFKDIWSDSFWLGGIGVDDHDSCWVFLEGVQDCVGCESLCLVFVVCAVDVVETMAVGESC